MAVAVGEVREVVGEVVVVGGESGGGGEAS